jgi:FkbM family methyltransferase
MREAVFTQSYSLIRDNAFKYIPQDLQPNVIMDLGASYGIIALSYATRYPNAKILAFEPDPQGYEYAKSLVDINRMDNVSLFNVAVDTKPGTRDLHTNRERCEYSSFFQNEANTGGNSDVIQVECIDIADFIRVHDIDSIDVLKVDIEGAEFAVFEHLDRQKLWPIIKNVFAEIHLDYGDYESTRLSSLIGILEDNGFFLKIHSTGSDSKLSRLLLWGSKDAIVT